MIAKTGLSTILWVTWNVPDAAILHLDEQLPRRTGDAARMAGKGDYSESILATALLFPHPPSWGYGRSARNTKEEQLATLERHKDALQFAEDHCRAHGLTRGIRALVARAYYHVDHHRLAEFCEVLCTGMPVKNPAERDHAAIAFRNWFVAKGGHAGTVLEMQKYTKGQTALIAFCEQRPLQKIYETEGDLFPVPEEISATTLLEAS